jgi:hypothetical protein
MLLLLLSLAVWCVAILAAGCALQDCDGQTPLHYAAVCQHEEVGFSNQQAEFKACPVQKYMTNSMQKQSCPRVRLVCSAQSGEFVVVQWTAVSTRMWRCWCVYWASGHQGRLATVMQQHMHININPCVISLYRIPMQVCRLLLEHGADPSITDNDSQNAQELSPQGWQFWTKG